MRIALEEGECLLLIEETKSPPARIKSEASIDGEFASNLDTIASGQVVAGGKRLGVRPSTERERVGSVTELEFTVGFAIGRVFFDKVVNLGPHRRAGCAVAA